MSGQPAVILASDTRADRGTDRLAILFDAHEERLYRLARRLTAHTDDARDLVHETFLRAATALTSIPLDRAKAEGWLVRVLVNIQRDHWRKQGVRSRATAALRATIVTDTSPVESALIVKRAVWAALDRLPPRQRAIVILHELEGLSLSAIATLLGRAELTVRWHLSMGRRDLKKQLASFMGETR